jgi:prepilin-type processing-associated H-X9-DG protein
VQEDSAPGSVGDYTASIGTTGFDFDVSETVNGVTTNLPSTGAFVSKIGHRILDIKDGTTNTLLFGEKHIPYGGGLTYPWDCNQFDGHNYICSTRTAGPGFPIAQSPTDTRVVFGGPHIGVCMFAFCDGSVHPVRSSIDEYALGLLAHRDDGQVAPTDY